MTFFCRMIASVNNLSYISTKLSNMPTNNIFTGTRVRTTFVNLPDNELYFFYALITFFLVYPSRFTFTTLLLTLFRAFYFLLYQN